jgi:hypothetical protein
MKPLVLIAAFSLGLNTSIVLAQQQQPPTSYLRDLNSQRPTNCADRTAAIDGTSYQTPADGLIIVIARLGDGETKANLNQRRLHNVRAYWTEFVPAQSRRKRETIILAEGEKVGGYGRLEFYVAGKLVLAISLLRNDDLHIGECYPPDDSYIRNNRFYPCEVKSNKIFYPCRDESARRRSRR